MLQAYHGYFKNGRFMPFETFAATIPEDVEVYITVTKKNVGATVQTIDENEIAKRREAVQSLKGIMAGYDVDLEQIREERLSKRGLLQ